MADSPDILKYFYEEPTLLEPVTPDTHPDARRRSQRPAHGPGASGPSTPIEQLLRTDNYYRGYLAGTRTDGEPHPDTDRVGLTTLPDPAVYVEPIMETLGQNWWGQILRTDSAKETPAVEHVTKAKVRAILAEPGTTDALVTSSVPLDLERVAAVAGTARRHVLEPLRDLLDAGAVVFFAEPAHDGHDWSFFSGQSMRHRLVEALRKRPAPSLRRFVLPYQKARSESKFYFETWQLKEPPLPEYIEEV